MRSTLFKKVILRCFDILFHVNCWVAKFEFGLDCFEVELFMVEKFL